MGNKAYQSQLPAQNWTVQNLPKPNEINKTIYLMYGNKLTQLLKVA